MWRAQGFEDGQGVAKAARGLGVVVAPLVEARVSTECERQLGISPQLVKQIDAPLEVRSRGWEARARRIGVEADLRQEPVRHGDVETHTGRLTARDDCLEQASR
jgi:hypothetical protein